jgi:hypothetical protein
VPGAFIAAPGCVALEADAQILDFLIRKEPDEGFVVQIPDLNAVPPGVPKIAAKPRVQLEPVLGRQFSPDRLHLLIIAQHEAEVLGAVRAHPVHFENGEKLMGPQLTPGGAFSAAEHFQIEDIGVKGDGLPGIIHLNGDMIDSIDVDA